MLEQKFNWQGILAEPGRTWHRALKQNRPSALIDTRCVWSSTGNMLTFNETESPELSTIDSFSASDGHAVARQKGVQYEVSTISLIDLLREHKAPEIIDYLSIDTEGSELEILEAFFRENTHYKIKIITCEHNFTPHRQKIYDLLTKYGYVRKLQSASRWDDFYVLQEK